MGQHLKKLSDNIDTFKHRDVAKYKNYQNIFISVLFCRCGSTKGHLLIMRGKLYQSRGIIMRFVYFYG